MLHVSTIEVHHKAQKIKGIAVKDFEYFIKTFIVWGLSEKLHKATISFVLSVCLSVRPTAWNNLAPAPTEWIFVKF